ncbi:MAG TPA: hypothetical protein VNA88_12915 [Candidatus Kapabacteria bacterium]|nr:hypothetical protein [Candidatus Kapabacteria bacterium]
MTPSPVRPPGYRRRKISIEIYFVLYLSAIVLLMGTTTRTKHEDPDALIRTLREFMVDFRVGVEKVGLIYTMLPAGLEVVPASEQLRRDSVNVVRAWGSVSDVRFEITGIRDTTTGQMLPVESATLENNGFSATVKWRPNGPMQNRVYAITIAASAEPEVPATIPSASRERVAAALRSEGRVHDTVTFTVTVFAVTNPNQIHAVAARQQQLPDTPSSPAALATVPSPVDDLPITGGTFAIVAGSDRVTAFPGRAWRNKVVFSGVTDFESQIEELTVAPSTVRKVSTSGGTLVLEGPSFGSPMQTVTISARRRSDGRSASESFDVMTGRLSDPVIPSDMYAGETYTLKFGTDGVEPGTISVRAREQGRVVAEGGAVLSYRPRVTGVVTFEREINGRPAGTYDATIRALPFPVLNWKKENAEHGIVTAKSYGTVDGRPNKVELKILDGNAADEPELIADDFDEETKTHIRTWRVWRQSPEKEFSFLAWAIDRRGSASGTKRRIILD